MLDAQVLVDLLVIIDTINPAAVGCRGSTPGFVGFPTVMTHLSSFVQISRSMNIATMHL